MSNRRYLVTLLMFLSVSINYMDRVNFSVSIPAIRDHFGFDLHQIGLIAFVWGIVYALFNFPGGWLVDRLGLRRALPLMLGWWSIFTIATPFARSLAGWCVVRGVMAAGEAPIWPINAKCANTWAAPKERSTLYTWAGSGQYVGPAIGAALAALILVRFGWQWTFISFGIAGLIIVPIWYAVVRDRPSQDPKVNAAELAWIGNRERPNEPIDWNGVRDVFFSRTGVGMLLVYVTFGYILFTFINWVPTYLFDTFNMPILKSGLWSSAGAFLGLAGFIISGPFNDGLARRYDRLIARRVGAVAPMLGAIVCMAASLLTARAGFAEATALSIGFAQLFMNMTVGAWAVTIIDIAPNQASTGFVYGIYNGVLNVMGAFNALIITRIATQFGFPLAFASAIIFMVIFIGSMLFVVDRPSYTRLTHKAAVARASG